MNLSLICNMICGELTIHKVRIDAMGDVRRDSERSRSCGKITHTVYSDSLFNDHELKLLEKRMNSLAGH